MLCSGEKEEMKLELKSPKTQNLYVAVQVWIILAYTKTFVSLYVYFLQRENTKDKHLTKILETNWWIWLLQPIVLYFHLFLYNISHGKKEGKNESMEVGWRRLWETGAETNEGLAFMYQGQAKPHFLSGHMWEAMFVQISWKRCQFYSSSWRDLFISPNLEDEREKLQLLFSRPGSNFVASLQTPSLPPKKETRKKPSRVKRKEAFLSVSRRKTICPAVPLFFSPVNVCSGGGFCFLGFCWGPTKKGFRNRTCKNGERESSRRAAMMRGGRSGGEKGK